MFSIDYLIISRSFQYTYSVKAIIVRMIHIKVLTKFFAPAAFTKPTMLVFFQKSS